MAREVLYRRSFHLDRDLRELENFFDSDRALVTRKGSADSRILAADGGFEAPRNSLDVPFSGTLEARRNSEVRCEDIPIGYELSRSLTTRRKNEDYSYLKPLTTASDQSFLRPQSNFANTSAKLDCKPHPRAPSVVARLMGLDVLPHQEALQSSQHSSLRRVLREEFDASHTLPTLNHANASLCSSDYEIPVEEVGFEKLSFRNHPQEKQLQEFKREFTARQAGKPSLSRLNLESLSMQHKCEQIDELNPQMDSEEFLDALHFLNANKDFFVKVLNDPQSSFTKHLQQSGGTVSGMKDGNRQHVRPKCTNYISECDVDPSAEVLAGWKKRQDLHQFAAADKERVPRNLRWGRDDEMPGRLQWRARGGSAVGPGGKVGIDAAAPTRIVVLKPNLGRQPIGKGSSPPSPLPRPDGVLRFRTEGKENAKQDVKLGGRGRNDGGLAMELFRDDCKDGTFDARAIAKRIVKHVKGDISQRPSREGMNILDLSGRRLRPLQRVGGLPGDGNGSVDGDVFQTGTRESGKFSSSLPCSPQSIIVDRETEHPHLSFNGRGYHMEETKGSSYKQTLKSSKEQSNEGGLQRNQGPSKKETGSKESKPVKRASQSNSLKVRDSKCEVPRVLPRSLSAPAAPCVENRALESERGAFPIERVTCSSRAKSSDNSAFKERLLSLKDSFSLSKKKSSRKPGTAQCGLALDSCSELPPLRHLGEEPTDMNEPCNRYLCRESPFAITLEVSNEATEKSLNEMLSESTPTPSGLPQWTSTNDLADTASETSLDKGEQPSPVSVLKTPFQEIPSSEDTMQKESTVHEYTCRLSQLGSDLKGLPRSLQVAFFSQPSSCHSSFDSSTEESLNIWNLIGFSLESFGLCDTKCPFASEAELTYIMHVLSLSGLIVNGLVMAHSLSSEHGLNKSLFGRLEAYYDNRCSTETSEMKGCTQAPLNPSSRKLLFDVVDEIIASSLKRRLLQPCTMSSDQRVLVCTSKQLLEEIVAHIKYFRFVQSGVEEDALEDIASRDLMREAPWVHSRSETELVVMELERLICGDVIRELVHDLRRMISHGCRKW